jgi:hypothetical protein
VAPPSRAILGQMLRGVVKHDFDSCAIEAATTRHPGYAISQVCRKASECIFGWGKHHGTLRKAKLFVWPRRATRSGDEFRRMPRKLGGAPEKNKWCQKRWHYPRMTLFYMIKYSLPSVKGYRHQYRQMPK